jgi:DNA-binding GntR family transcriptional regulator
MPAPKSGASRKTPGAAPALPLRRPAAGRKAGDAQRLGGALAQVSEGGSVEDRIYKAIFDGVMGQRLAPGTKLPESSLCELFNASRSTVRQVLQRLAHDHIVQLRPNRGATIAVPTPEETRQIFEARRELEGSLIRLAAQRITPADIVELRAKLAQEHQAMHRFDQPAWARLASGFHLYLAELSGNALLRRYLIEIVSRCSLIVALYEAPGNAVCEHDEHEKIVDCLARGDAEGATALMVEHIHGLEQRIQLHAQRPAPSLKELLGL